MMAIKVDAVFSTNARNKKCMPDFGRKQNDHLEDLAIEGTTLKLMLHKHSQRMSSGFNGLK
jgi:hypothetical protein